MDTQVVSCLNATPHPPSTARLVIKWPYDEGKRRMSTASHPLPPLLARLSSASACNRPAQVGNQKALERLGGWKGAEEWESSRRGVWLSDGRGEDDEGRRRPIGYVKVRGRCVVIVKKGVVSGALCLPLT